MKILLGGTFVTITAQLLRYMIITSFRMFSIMSPGENTRPILKKKKMILSIELIEENTYARTSFDDGNRALKLKRKPS